MPIIRTYWWRFSGLEELQPSLRYEDGQGGKFHCQFVDIDQGSKVWGVGKMCCLMSSQAWHGREKWDLYTLIHLQRGIQLTIWHPTISRFSHQLPDRDMNCKTCQEFSSIVYGSEAVQACRAIPGTWLLWTTVEYNIVIEFSIFQQVQQIIIHESEWWSKPELFISELIVDKKCFRDRAASTRLDQWASRASWRSKIMNSTWHRNHTETGLRYTCLWFVDFNGLRSSVTGGFKEMSQ